MTETSCLFCRIVSGEIPTAIIARNQFAVAFRDIAPRAPVHVLVIPLRHIPSLSAADDAAELGQLALLAAEVARQEGIADSGYRVVANTGVDGGQSVHHLHLHVMGGRTMDWPPG